MNERIIVSLTSYKQRIEGLPVTLDSIFAQTVPPDLVVLNLANGEELSSKMQSYFKEKRIELFYVDDTKVYKKLIPTLKRYPDDLVICIDDDWIYPPQMIEEFMEFHKKHPENPISGNHVVEFGMACHCGCASLTKAAFMGDFLQTIDVKELLEKCPCDDVAYTYFSIQSGHPYFRTANEYFLNLTPNGEGGGYSEEMERINGIEKSFRYLTAKYGELPDFSSQYIADNELAQIVSDIHRQQLSQTKEEVKRTARYKIGNVVLSPLSLLKRLRK
jgi:hypothetical protein